jgi:hypothetical protein
MVPAHVAELVKLGWNAKTEDLPNGVKLTVITSDPKEWTKLKALGFMGDYGAGRASSTAPFDDGERRTPPHTKLTKSL